MLFGDCGLHQTHLSFHRQPSSYTNIRDPEWVPYAQSKRPIQKKNQMRTLIQPQSPEVCTSPPSRCEHPGDGAEEDAALPYAQLAGEQGKEALKPFWEASIAAPAAAGHSCTTKSERNRTSLN